MKNTFRGKYFYSDNSFMKRFLIFTAVFFMIFLNSAQSSISHPLSDFGDDGFTTILYTGENNYILTERTDLRLYTNGKYTGLVSKEVSSFIIPSFKDGQKIYEGLFYVNKDTKHNQKKVADGIHDAISSVFKINEEGELFMIEDNGYPTFRSFPSFTSRKIKKGDVWQARAVRVVDPLDKGIVTKMPIEVQYTYAGDEKFRDEDVYLITAQWATRYGMSASSNIIDWNGDYELEKAGGSHSATMYVSKKTGTALVIRDSVDETFYYTDGNFYQYKGTITLFTEYPPAVNREKLLPAIQKKQSDSEKFKNISVRETEAGLCLTVEDLKFEPDSANLLFGEDERLSQIAEILLQSENSKFLIEGHTASTGNPEGEKKLSLERAKSVAEKLSRYGIEKTRFICRGSGSAKPVASNDNPEGKAKNRRVEITILE